MPDEPSWGHARRLLRENGIYDLRALLSILKCEESPEVLKSIRFQKVFYGLLAYGAETPQSGSYFERHCMLPQLSAPRLFGWRWEGMHRWILHHATYYPSPLVERSCPQCALEDLVKHGFSWFRRVHQLPGVNWCLQHECGLNGRTSSRSPLDPRSFRNVGPTTSAAPFLRIHEFVRRYLLALNWLRTLSDYLAWEAATSVIESASGGLFRSGDSSFNDHIKSAAPTTWYVANFVDVRAIGLRQLVPDMRYRTAHLALAVASITQSDGDVDELIRLAASRTPTTSPSSQ